VGNNLRSVAGVIVTRDPIAVSGTILTHARERSGPRYPRPHLQMIVVDAKR
jgi:hypothetical protein